MKRPARYALTIDDHGLAGDGETGKLRCPVSLHRWSTIYRDGAWLTRKAWVWKVGLATTATKARYRDGRKVAHGTARTRRGAADRSGR